MTSSRYPRPGQELRPDQLPQQVLPLELHPVQALPIDFPSSLGIGVRATNVLFRMKLKSMAAFCALDEETLSECRNCGKKTAAEIMDVVRRYRPSSATIPQTPDMLALCPSQENTPITYLRLSVRATNALESLNISTVGQLARISDRELLDIQNFGMKSLREVHLKLSVFRSRGFVIWPAEERTAGELSRRITRAARKLQRLRSATAVLRDDPRFGHLIRELGLDVTSLREAADTLVARKTDPVNPQLLIRLLIELHRTVRAAARMPLEAELYSLTDGLGSERDRRIMVIARKAVTALPGFRWLDEPFRLVLDFEHTPKCVTHANSQDTRCFALHRCWRTAHGHWPPSSQERIRAPTSRVTRAMSSAAVVPSG